MHNSRRLLAIAIGVCFGSGIDPAAAQADRGGVVFYAGFDGTRDAQTSGNGKATLVGGGGTIIADGFGVRGGALRSGDAVGYVEFSLEGNVLPDEGTIEIWIKPEDWTSDDGKQHFFIDVAGNGGYVRYYKRADTVNSLVVKAPGVKDPNHFDDKYAGIVQTGYSCQQKKDRWVQYFLRWRKGKFVDVLRGGTKFNEVHGGGHADGLVPSPGKLDRIRIGDFAGGEGRDAHSIIDEVYIYSRMLTPEECRWANAHTADRAKGMDIPSTFAEPTIKVVPDPENKTLVVEVDSGDRTGNFAGRARLEPAVGTKPAAIVVTEGRFGEAAIPYTELPPGDYQAIADVTTKDGKPIKTVACKLIVPGPPVWLTEKAGISDTPPPPWGPIELDGKRLSVWGREYQLGAFGLPEEAVTQSNAVLAGPVTLRCVRDGKEVSWSGAPGQVTKKTAAQVIFAGASRGVLGEMKWRTTAEYDGFLLHDLELTPARGAKCELMELRVPINKACARLLYKGYSNRRLLPEKPGVLHQEGGFGRYWWIGTDDFGFCGATEHGGANLDKTNEDFSIVRQPNGDVHVIYRFLSEAKELTGPWKLRLILQATPTKPLPKKWRVWRDASRFGVETSNDVKLAVAAPWPHEAKFLHFAFPVVKDPNWYRGYVKGWHDKNARVLPYSLLIAMAPDMPECAFYWREWFNPVMGLKELSSWPKYVSARYVPSYIDFMVWKHRELAREYGHDGLYVDYAGVYGPVLAPEQGLGYVRDGKEYAAVFPICAVREMWKRVYTMFKEINPDSAIVGHTSTVVHAPVLSFCDVWLNGEHNWRGPLRDNYLEVLPLEALRAAFRAQAHGGIPWWLPQWYGADLEDKHVLKRQPNGQPDQVTVEKSHHLFGLALLHDIGVWPICGMNGESTKQYWAIQDAFDIGDAEFFGYWDNADLIGGQTEAIKASAYRNKNGALLCVYNTTREAQQAALEIDWDRL